MKQVSTMSGNAGEFFATFDVGLCGVRRRNRSSHIAAAPPLGTGLEFHRVSHWHGSLCSSKRQISKVIPILFTRQRRQLVCLIGASLPSLAQSDCRCRGAPRGQEVQVHHACRTTGTIPRDAKFYRPNTYQRVQTDDSNRAAPRCRGVNATPRKNPL